MILQEKIRQLNAEWADAGDDVPTELQVIRELVNRLRAVERAWEDRGMINWCDSVQQAANDATDFAREFQP